MKTVTKLNNRLTAIFLAAFLLFNAVAPCTAAAADTGAVAVYGAEGLSGEIVYVDIALEANPGIVSMSYDVEYDTDVLELVSVKDANILGEDSHSPTLSSPYRLSWINDTSIVNYTACGTAVTLGFKISDNVYDGQQTEISLSYSLDDYDIYNKYGEAVEFTVYNGYVTCRTDQPDEKLELILEKEIVDDQLYLYLNIENNPGIWSAIVDLEYNTASLSPVQIINGDVFSDSEYQPGPIFDGLLRYFALGDDVTVNNLNNGNLATIVFDIINYEYILGFNLIIDPDNIINCEYENVLYKVTDYAGMTEKNCVTQFGQYETTYSYYYEGEAVIANTERSIYDGESCLLFDYWTAEGVTLSNGAEYAIDLSFSMPLGDVFVSEERYIHGDVNNDGALNALDRAELMKIIYNAQYTKYADISLDGEKINALDSFQFKRIMKGIYSHTN